MIKYSIVIPFYNEEKNIFFVIRSLKKILKKIKEIEFILVNNGSTDGTLEKLLFLQKDQLAD